MSLKYANHTVRGVMHVFERERITDLGGVVVCSVIVLGVHAWLVLVSFVFACKMCYD